MTPISVTLHNPTNVVTRTQKIKDFWVTDIVIETPAGTVRVEMFHDKCTIEHTGKLP